MFEIKTLSYKQHPNLQTSAEIILKSSAPLQKIGVEFSQSQQIFKKIEKYTSGSNNNRSKKPSLLVYFEKYLQLTYKQKPKFVT